MATILEQYHGDPSEFERLLALAEGTEKTIREEDFVHQLRERFDKFQGAMFISDSQARYLRDIAGRA